MDRKRIWSNISIAKNELERRFSSWKRFLPALSFVLNFCALMSGKDNVKERIKER
jgi:hypothetical protein